jgi:hypothetical protein
VLSGLALLALFPCSWLPNYRPGELPDGQPPKADRPPAPNNTPGTAS